MNSTIFIRRRRVLAAWLLVPVLAIALTEFGSWSFYSYQKASYLRKQALDRCIPEMLMESQRFEQFIGAYTIDATKSLSIEDTTIELVSMAAGAARLKITSIGVVQERDETRNTIKVYVAVNGIGSCRSVSAFLRQVKKHDPGIFEEHLALARTYDGSDNLQVEAKLGRIYIGNKGVRP